MIVFGGIDDSTRYVTPDVWVLRNANGFGGVPTWSKLTAGGGPPTAFAESEHSTVYDQSTNRLIMFGGCSATAGACNLGTNAVWILTNANGIGGTPEWSQLTISGTQPVARVMSSAVYDPLSNRLIVHGGDPKNSSDTNLSDTWILTHANGLGGTAEWVPVTASGALPRRNHFAAYDPITDRMFVAAGVVVNAYSGAESNDTWILTNATAVRGTPSWRQEFPLGGPPAGRQDSAAIYDRCTNRLVMVGGYASGTFLSDTWSLTFSASGTSPGLRTVSVKTGAEEITGSNVLTVVATNQPPLTNAGPDQTIALAGKATLTGVVSDDGLPSGVPIVAAWTKLSGPGVVTFANSASLLTTAVFSAPGVYALRLTTSDSQLTSSDDVIITVNPSGVPSILSISPNSGPQGQGGPVVITAQDTHFVQGTTTVDFGAGIAVGNVNVTCLTCISVQIQIDPAASVGTRTLTITTGPEVVVVTNGFTVQPGTPALLSIAPAQAQQGQTLQVTITGQFTHFVQGTTTASFGAGIATTGLVVSSPTTATAVISITAGAATGSRNLTLTTGTETVALNGFFVSPAACVTTSPPGLIGWWPAEGNAGDLSGSNHNGTAQGAVTYAPGFMGQAFSFAGSNGIINIPATADLDTPNAVTVAAWVKPSSFVVPLFGNTYPMIVGKAGNYQMDLEHDGRLSFGFPGGPGGTGSNTSVTSLSTVPTTSFTFMAGTYDSSTGKLRVYINGVLENESGASGLINSASVALQIGGFYGTGYGAVTGLIDEVRLYSRALSPTEIQAVYALKTCDAPALTSVSPTSGIQGQQNLTVTLTGQNTHFAQGTTTASFGTGVTTNSLTVTSPTTALAVIGIDALAASGGRDVSITTGAEVVTLANAFAVILGAPSILIVNPNTTQQGRQGLAVELTGQLTHFLQGTTQANFGAGITIASFTVNSGASATAVLNVSSTAAVGLRDVTLTTGTEVVTLSGGFTIGSGVCSAPPPGLLAWWPGEGNGNDLAGLHNGALQGGTSFVSGLAGQGFHFDGSTGLMLVPFTQDLDLRDAVTMQAWVNPSSYLTPSGPSVTGYVLISGRPYSYQMTLRPDGHALFSFPSGTSGVFVNVRIDSATVVPKGTFTLISASYSSAQGRLRIYLNGSLDKEVAYTGLMDSVSKPFFLGAYSDPSLPAGYGAWTGTVDEVQLFNRELTPAEVLATFALGSFGYCKDLPKISSVSPNSGQQGQLALSVSITGQNTHFVQGATIATFGAGITAATLTVNSATSATAVLNIDPAAALGARNVALTTGGEVAMLSNGFTVNLPSCVVPPSALVAWWPGEGNYADIIGFNTGTPTGVVAFAAGEVGQAFSFDGASSVRVPSSSALLLGAGEMTLDAWINTPPWTGIGNFGQIVAKVSPSSPYQGYSLRTTPDNRVEFTASDCGTGGCGFSLPGGPGTRQPIRSISVVANGKWHHVAGVRRADGSREIYVDGVLENTRSEGMWNTDSNTPLYLGAADETGGPQRFTGLIDEVQIFSRALSAAEIQAIFTSGVNGECKTQSVTPVISSVAPSSGKQGQTLQVTLTGFYTHFAQGTTQVSFGTGIAVSNITVSSPTSLTAQLIIDPAAAIGARTPTVTIGTEVVSLIGGFTITSGNLAPVVTASAGCSQTVSILPASITVTEYPVSTVAGGLHGITVGPDCNLWASDYFGHKIWKIGTDGTSTPFPLTSNASDIAAGLDGNLWFTEQLANKIGRISPSGVISEFAIPTSGAPFRFGSTEPINIVAGPDGNMWFTEFAANQIGRITPAGVITEFPIPTGGGPLNGISGSAPEPLTVGPDGNIWFGEGYGGKVGRITPTGVLTEFPVPSPPSAITTGADGNLWFGEIATNKIARMTPGGLVTGEFLIPTSNSVPNWIISGPDGNLWFVEEGGNKIARITTSGVITEFVVPTAGSTPFAIVAAPDGNLWFTENDGRNVGKINPFTGVAIANLTGTVVDDGRPAGATLGTTWTTTNGPASATFSSPSASFSDFAGVTNAVSARATFTAAGVYTLTLTGSDSQLSGLASLQVTVNSAASAPILVSVTPNSGQQGQQSLSITITGQNTHFVQGSTTASLGAGITVTSLTVNSTTTATAVLNIDASAIVASRTIILTTGTEAASLANGFAVTASASIFSVSPNAGPQGQGGPVAIVGVNTHFVQGTTTVDFGAGIIVSNIAITCGTCLTVQLQIDPAAAVGSRTLTVTTGSEVVSLANAFTVQPGIPILTSLVPAQGQQGQTLPVTLTGLYTHWAQGTTQLSFGASITVSNITVSSATSLTAQLAIDGTATVGTRTPTVTTGVEVVSQANIFSVLAAVPIIMTLNPGSGQQGRTNLSVTITGQSTHFVPGTSQASFGAGVTVISLTVASATSATAVINLDPAAAVGARTVTVTTVAEVASFTNGFAIVAGSPSVLSVSPNTSVQGQQSLSIAITGNLTHFVQGTTQASFGAGVTVGSLSITSPTTATAALNIAPTASVGLRGVTLTTGTEVATLQGGFAVNPATLITLLSPSTGQQGQQNLSIAISGQATHFVQGTTTANFGAGITVASLAVSSPTTAAAVLNISAGATLGTRTVTLATGAEAVSLANGFTIGTGNPVVTQVSPNVGRQGQPNLSVTVTGQYTNFAQGVTQVSFGQGITIGSVAVSSSTSLTATITIGATTPLGARTVIVTTGAEVASLANAFSVTTAINQSPIITIAPAWSVTIPARLLVTYSVTDDGLPLGGVLTVSWDTVSTPPGGNVGYQSQTPTSISVGFDTPGNYTLRITVTDTQFTVVKTIAVTATQTVIPPPTVSITTPTDGAEVTGPLNVIGSVGSQALTNWLLEYSGPGETVYHTVSTGTTTVTNASLGTFDPTTLINGTAYLRLTATDTSGQSTTIGPLSVLLTRNQKIGNFTVSFNDVTVPMAGLPIQVVRTYDSRRRFQPGNDFTYGWTLDINGGTLTEAAPLGDQWNETTTGGAFPTYCINPVKVHTYTMALPDGTTYSFLPKLTPQCQSLVPILQSTFGFTPTGATPPNVTLAVVGNNTVAVNGTLGPVTFLDADGFSTFDPDQYILTLGDGRKLQFSLASGLQKLTDLNSNTITLTPGAITHSSGKSVMITRNAAHQITKITDPAGGSVLYGYNVVTGDLTSVTDRSSQTTNFTYRADHGLLTIQDPRGVQPIRNVYDDTGGWFSISTPTATRSTTPTIRERAKTSSQTG